MSIHTLALPSALSRLLRSRRPVLDVTRSLSNLSIKKNPKNVNPTKNTFKTPLQFRAPGLPAVVGQHLTRDDAFKVKRGRRDALSAKRQLAETKHKRNVVRLHTDTLSHSAAPPSKNTSTNSSVSAHKQAALAAGREPVDLT